MNCRVQAVWLASGTGTAPADTDDLIDDNGNVVTPGSVEALIDLFNPGNQACPGPSFVDPVVSLTGGNIGPQFSLVEFDVVVPAGSEWLAMQLESPRDNGGFEGLPESGAWAGSGLLLIPEQTQQQDPDILIEKTVLDGAGQPCPGVEGEDELVVGAPGDPVTYCFRVENTGDTFLFPVVIEDPDLGISNLDMTLVSGDDSVPFPPGGELVYSYETVIDGDLLNVATVTGTPVDEEGNPLDLPDVTDDNDAEVDEEIPETTTTVPELTVTLDAFCDNDTPWLAYDIVAPGLSDEATITFSEGADSAVYTVAVGSGQVLWPGAEIDAAGNPIDWPGWDQDADGVWFVNPDNPFAWARGTVEVTVEVNPTFGPVTLDYPPAEPTCDASPGRRPPPTIRPTSCRPRAPSPAARRCSGSCCCSPASPWSPPRHAAGTADPESESGEAGAGSTRHRPQCVAVVGCELRAARLRVGRFGAAGPDELAAHRRLDVDVAGDGGPDQLEPVPEVVSGRALAAVGHHHHGLLRHVDDGARIGAMEQRWGVDDHELVFGW